MKTTIWESLSQIDCSKHTEKKGTLTYLSWAWAWGTLMKHYPTARYQFTDHKDINGNITDVLIYSDGTVSVECTVTIEDLSRTISLPVMDHRNQAIQQPNSRQISDSKMRCLVKAIAMHGLGFYIYAGEDLPESPTTSVLNKDKSIKDTVLTAGPKNTQGETYGEAFKSIGAINEQIAYWQGRDGLNERQSQHLSNLQELLDCYQK